MNKPLQLLFCFLFLTKVYKQNDINEEINKFFNIKRLKDKLEKDNKQNLLSNNKKQTQKPLTKEEKQNKIKNYRRYLKQIKTKKYNTPEKTIIFNLAQEFLAKSIKSRRLKLEECIINFI